MITQCYLCKKYKIHENWYPIPFTIELDISHGLCPECAKKEKERIMREIKELELINDTE